MRYFLLILCVPLLLFSQTPELSVSENGRYLVTEEGKPFLWIGDTIWGLFHRTTRETAETYFAKRAEQGFNVIQACITAAGYWPGLEENAYGEKPFFMNDPAKPNDDFFEHVDWVIDKAADYGLYIGLLPTWGEYVCPAWHDGPKIFNPDNAYKYGKYIANQFGAKSNVIWILGGDRKGDQCGTEDIEIWDAMLTGLEEVDPNTLKTYHPNGDPNSSSRWFQYESRLDIHMIETYKNAGKIYPFVLADYLRLPRKPVVLGEPAYEFEVNYDLPTRVLRSQPYWAFFAGAAGYTFGRTFFAYLTDEAHPHDWRQWPSFADSLDSPGALWLQICTNILSSTTWWNLEPDPSILVSTSGTGLRKIAAARIRNESTILIYFPAPTKAEIRTDALGTGNKGTVTWIDPKTGKRTSGGSVPGGEFIKVETPGTFEDAVLLIE